MTLALAGGALLDLDVAVRDWCLVHRREPLYLISRGLNQLGSARLMAAVCLALAVPLAVRTRSARPILPVMAAYAMSYLLIGPIKVFADRAAPRSPGPDAARLFADPDGMSYPSGHAANTFIWFYVLTLLLARWQRAWWPTWSTAAALRWRRARLTLRATPPTVVAFTVTYLAFHWFTDMLAGVLLGLLLDRWLRRVAGRFEQRVTDPMDTCRSGD